MGADSAMRWFLYHLCPEAFSSTAPSNWTPDLIAIDNGGFLDKARHGNQENEANSTGRGVVQEQQELVTNYLAQAGKAVLLAFDDPTCVPQNKAFAQSSRDKRKSNGHNLSLSQKTMMPDEVFLTRDRATALSEGVYTCLRGRESQPYSEQTPIPRDAFHLISWDTMLLCDKGMLEERRLGLPEVDPQTGRVSPDVLFRSKILQPQFVRMITEGLFHVEIPAGKRLHLDGVYPYTEERMWHLACDTLRGFRPGYLAEQSEYARLCIALQSGAVPAQEVTIFPKEVVHLHDRSFAGEAEASLLRYILPKSVEPEYERILVVSADQDVLYMLLMHMIRLIETGSERIEKEVWIDSHMVGRPDENAMPYRYCNVPVLWRAIHRFFADWMPRVTSPIETLVFLTYFSGSDFTDNPFRGGGVGLVKIWNAFAMLATGRPNGEYPSMSRQHVKPVTLDAVRDRHILESPLYRQRYAFATMVEAQPLTCWRCDRHIQVRERLAKQFYIFLYSGSLSKYFAGAKAAKKALDDKISWKPPNFYACDSEDSFRVAVTSLSASLDEMVELHHVHRLPLPKGLCAAKDRPHRLGFPSRNALHALIRRRIWVVHYYANSSVTPSYGTNWFDLGSSKSVSRWGWRIQELGSLLLRTSNDASAESPGAIRTSKHIRLSDDTLLARDLSKSHSSSSSAGSVKRYEVAFDGTCCHPQVDASGKYRRLTLFLPVISNFVSFDEFAAYIRSIATKGKELYREKQKQKQA